MCVPGVTQPVGGIRYCHTSHPAQSDEDQIWSCRQCTQMAYIIPGGPDSVSSGGGPEIFRCSSHMWGASGICVTTGSI